MSVCVDLVSVCDRVEISYNVYHKNKFTGYAGTYSAFANTCPAKRAEVAEKYAPARTNGHDVIPCVFEVFGGAAPEVLSLLESWGRAARSNQDAPGRRAAVVGSQLYAVLVAAPFEGSPARRRH